MSPLQPTFITADSLILIIPRPAGGCVMMKAITAPTPFGSGPKLAVISPYESGFV
jgi:hypothetical protein